MKTERRALTPIEREAFTKTVPSQNDWMDQVFFPALGMACLGLLIFLLIGVAFWSLSLDIKSVLGVEPNTLMLTLFFFGGLLEAAHLVWDERRDRKASLLRKTQILERDDLIVEIHDISECKLVRDPEHGQCMYFVRSLAEKILFVSEGQDLAEGDWEKWPLSVPEDLRARKELKIIRWPDTGESIMCEFLGAALPVHTCHVIGLGSGSWPSSGKLITSPWDTIDHRYRLKAMALEEA